MSISPKDVDQDELAMVIGRAVLSRMDEIGMELDDIVDALTRAIARLDADIERAEHRAQIATEPSFELALAEVDMIIGVVGADRDCRRMLLCSDRERMRAAERERDARPPITPEMAAARDRITAARCAGNTVPAHLYNLAARADDALRAHAAKAVL